MYEASVSGDSLPLDGVADRAARFASRFRASSADVSEDVDEYEGMDLEEIAAMGLSEGARMAHTVCLHAACRLT